MPDLRRALFRHKYSAMLVFASVVVLTRIIHEVVVYSEKWLRMAGTDGVWGCGCE